MNYDKIYEVFKTFNQHTDDYLGALFINIFNQLPECFKIYYGENDKLQYINSIESFHNIRKNIKSKIDSRKLLNNLKKLDWVETFCYSANEFLILNKYDHYPFLMNITLNDDGEMANYYEEVFCRPKDIDVIFNDLEEYFDVSQKEESVSFGIAAIDPANCVYTSWYDYKYKDIDVDKNYNDDFKVPYEKICNIIKEDDKTGLILFYGEPGTGKTSIIKNLISKYPDRDFVFIDDSLLLNASREKMMSYFLENQNTVFILEDCEKVLMSRDKGYNPVINIILNITDGIIGDVLGIKLICTFNTSLQNIDKALLRKGRLSVKYEFGKLKADKVSKILGREVKQDMTLADIYNVDEENDFSKNPARKIGF